MKFEWDKKKNNLNIQKHGLDFVDAFEMFQNPMVVTLDERKDYKEERYVGLGLIKERVIVVAFTERSPNIIRIISLRKANKREQTKFKERLEDKLETHRHDER
jgi:uncharacterized protein